MTHVSSPRSRSCFDSFLCPIFHVQQRTKEKVGLQLCESKHFTGICPHGFCRRNLINQVYTAGSICVVSESILRLPDKRDPHVRKAFVKPRALYFLLYHRKRLYMYTDFCASYVDHIPERPFCRMTFNSAGCFFVNQKNPIFW